MQIIHNVSGPEYVTVCTTSYFLTVIMQKGNTVIHDRWAMRKLVKMTEPRGGLSGTEVISTGGWAHCCWSTGSVFFIVNWWDLCLSQRWDWWRTVTSKWVLWSCCYISQLFEACFMKSLFLFRSYLFIHFHTQKPPSMTTSMWLFNASLLNSKLFIFRFPTEGTQKHQNNRGNRK